jgi:hypothetical protein
MKAWVWILIGFVIVLLFSSREGFSSTETIKDPSTWNSEEIDRIRSMTTPMSKATDKEIRDIVGGFWNTWTSETTQITMSQIVEYLNMKNVPPQKRGEFSELLKKYYIEQGTPVFQKAREYVPEETKKPEEPAKEEKLLVRPSLSDAEVRQTISSYSGIPVNKDVELQHFERRMQKFYDTVYTKKETVVTLSDINRFVYDETINDVPEQMKPSFKSQLTSILDYYFTEPGFLPPGDTTKPMKTPDKIQPLPEGGLRGLLQGMNVYGPVYVGAGESSIVKGDSTRTAIYPSLLGGFGGSATPKSSADQVANVRTLSDFALPPLDTLGVDERSKFLPYSRVPGDMDVIRDPYRLGNTAFSTSTYSSTKTDPVPFLTDFSAFLK